MPDLFGQQGGQWLPSFRPGNWVGSWGARPNDFGHQTAYSYFQQNPNQMENYNGGRLGNAFQSWFGGNQQGGPTGGGGVDPRSRPPINNALYGVSTNGRPNFGNEGYPQQPPPASGTPKPGMLGNLGNAYTPSYADPYTPPTQQPYEPFGNMNPGTPKFPNQPDPTTQTPQLPGRPIVNPQGTGGIGDFRRRGWF